MNAPVPRLQLRAAVLDPALQVACAPFATWIGIIRVNTSGDALLLRSSGEEDRLPIDPDHARLVELALAEEGLDVQAGTGTWLPIGWLHPMLASGTGIAALGVVARLAPPRVEHEAAGGALRAITMRAALLDGTAGWAGACEDPAWAPISAR